MHIDPLSTALKEIKETKDIVDSLINASENFDYPMAKAALKDLNRKVRELTRLRSKFEAIQKATQPNIYILDFKAPLPASTDPRQF